MLIEQYHSRTMTASGYCKLVFDLSQQLRAKDVEALQYMYKVSTENITHLGVLKALEKRGVFSSSNIQGLKTLLRNIDRCDLLDMLREDKRLELCYLQAVSVEEKLEAISVKLAQFCAKQECSPTERSFCSTIMESVQEVQRGVEQFLTQPLKEVYHENTDSRLCCNARANSTSSVMGRSEPAGDFSLSMKALQTAAAKHNKLAEDCDYDLLSPIGTNPSRVTSAAIPYACTSLVGKQQRRSPKHSIAIADTKLATHLKPLAGSMPTTPLFAQRKPLNRSSSSDCLLGPTVTTQVSKLPILKRRPSPKKCTLGSGSDVDTSGGSGEDSGFADASEFALFKFDSSQRASGNADHLYSRPNNFTVNALHTYSVPTKR